MDIREFIKGIDGNISYLECYELIGKLKESKDNKSFRKVLEQESSQKEKLESGLIYLVANDEEKDFAQKYNSYLIEELESDARNYLNNAYCTYLLFTAIMDERKENVDNLEKAFINGKTINKCFDDIEEKANELYKKIDSNEELESSDKIFLESIFSFYPSIFVAFKEVDGEDELIPVIVKYFNKYPIKDLSTPKNKQLYILYILSKKLMELPDNCGISYTLKEQKRDNVTIGGSVYTRDDGIPIIVINDLDLYNLDSDTKLLEKIFILFHEVGHVRQKLKLKEYTKEQLELIDLENELVIKRRDFYHKYYNDFYIEQEADAYATKEIINEFGETYPKIVVDIVERIKITRKMDFIDFYKLELEEYEKIGEQNE